MKRFRVTIEFEAPDDAFESQVTSHPDDGIVQVVYCLESALTHRIAMGDDDTLLAKHMKSALFESGRNSWRVERI